MSLFKTDHSALRAALHEALRCVKADSTGDHANDAALLGVLMEKTFEGHDTWGINPAPAQEAIEALIRRGNYERAHKIVDVISDTSSPLAVGLIFLGLAGAFVGLVWVIVTLVRAALVILGGAS
mgnify:FL=1|jgi:hypothetical protein